MSELQNPQLSPRYLFYYTRQHISSVAFLNTRCVRPRKGSFTCKASELFCYSFRLSLVSTAYSTHHCEKRHQVGVGIPPSCRGRYNHVKFFLKFACWFIGSAKRCIWAYRNKIYLIPRQKCGGGGDIGIRHEAQWSRPI